MSVSALPYWRISSYYLFYFAILGATVPYWNLYLLDIGFSPLEIGWITAITLTVRIIAPNLWGWLADRSGQRMAVVRWGMALALGSFMLVAMDTRFVWIAVTLSLFSFFWNACLAQFEANTMNHLADQNSRYGLLRLWGSIGFIAVVGGGGVLLERYGIGLLIPLVEILIVGALIASLLVPSHPGKPQDESQRPLLSVMKQPKVILFLLVVVLMQASHGPYYTFFSIYLESLGYSRGLVGYLWALGVVAEVGVFILLARWLPILGVSRVLLFSMVLAALRWVLIGVAADSLVVLLIAQLLHAATFGAFHAAAIAHVHELFSGRNQGRGQALFSSAGFGLGGALGGLYSGYAWEGIGPSGTFLIAALLAAIGALLALFFERPAQAIV
ncbi:MAG: MFS transporter [Immundisolibacteraceae bacterium]|nr:MFS transporter [Immundisolibacteraceae bacterium]